MPLALIQGCCSGPGIIRGFQGGVGYLINPFDDTPEPCWRGGDLIGSPLLGHIIGYDADRDWLLFTDGVTPAGTLDTVPDLSTVHYYDFRVCEVATGDAIEIIDSTVSAAVQALAEPSTNAVNISSHWSCLSKATIDDVQEYRIYGWTFWNIEDAPTFWKFKAWSVNYEGSDFIEHFTFTLVETNHVLPKMTVRQGVIVTTELEDFNTGKVRVDGSATSIDGTQDATVTSFGGLIGLLGYPHNAFVGDPTADLYFAFVDDDGITRKLYAASMGWNEKHSGLEILWVGEPLKAGFPNWCVTLSTISPTAGNIVGQDGTTIRSIDFDQAIYNFENAAALWHHPITLCSLPRPAHTEPAAESSFDCVSGICTHRSDLDGAYIELTDCVTSECAPPPETYNCVAGTCFDPNDGTGIYSTFDDCVAAECGAPTCFSLDGCTSMLLVMEIKGLAYCTDGTYEYFLNALNGVNFLPYLSGSYLFHIDYGTLDDHDNPGRLYKQKIIVDDTREESYAYAVDVTVHCEDGRTTIYQIDWYYQTFSWTLPDDPAVTASGSFGSNPTDVLRGTARTCGMSYMLSIFPPTAFTPLSECSGGTTFTIDGNVG